MKIGIDLDNVMVDFVNPFLAYLNEKEGKNVKYEDIKFFEFWKCGIFKDKDEELKFVSKFWESSIMKGLPLIEGAKENIEKIYLNNEILVVTSRGGKIEGMTEEYLKRYFGKMRVIFSNNYLEKGDKMGKAEICKELGIDVMIEDNGETSVNCAKAGIKVLLFDKPWNQGVSHENIIRVKSWEEILKLIKNGEKDESC